MAAELSVVGDIAERYAAALFDLAQERGRLDEAARDLDSLRQMLDESPELTRLIRSPAFTREAQGKALAAVLDRAGAGDLVRNFVGLVARNRRLFALRDMTRAYRKLLAQHRGEVVAQLTSAYPLEDEQLASIKAELSAAMKTDVNLEATVDENILGGLIVRVGSRMIDSSIRTKLQNLKFAMKGAE